MNYSEQNAASPIYTLSPTEPEDLRRAVVGDVSSAVRPHGQVTRQQHRLVHYRVDLVILICGKIVSDVISWDITLKICVGEHYCIK